MEKGTISKIFDYYFGKAQLKEKILRALREFFNKPKDEKVSGTFSGVYKKWFPRNGS